MEVKEIPVSSIQVSEFNVRKNLADGQHDSTIDDLAKSIAKQDTSSSEQGKRIWESVG